MDVATFSLPKFRRFVLVALVVAAALVAMIDRGGKVRTASVSAPIAAPWHSTPDVLRVRFDPVYDRVWVLGLDRIDIYYRPTQKLIRQVALPSWSIADFVCEPDVAFDRSGTAYISHNLQPTLWQIDPDMFELKEHAIRLVGREALDIGFGSLTFAADGGLYAVASSGKSVWRIDLGSESARQVDMPAMPMEECLVRGARLPDLRTQDDR